MRLIDLDAERRYLLDARYFVGTKEDIPTWIPCSERLPSEGDCVIAQCADGRLELMPSVRMNIWKIMSQYSAFVAWMPIQPYKEKNDE